MTQNQTNQETFAEFKNSFAYGTRTDLNFKFLKNMSEEDVADFFQELLWKLGDAFDDGQFDRVRKHVQRGQARAYAGATQWTYDEGPFTSLSKPLSKAKVALLTSTGHFVEGDDPEPFGIKQMSQNEAIERINDFLKAEPQLSTIPVDTPHHKLRARHGGYDIRGVQADPNVAFPLDRLSELANDGIIGQFAPAAYSFVGACAQTRLLRHTGPKWVEIFQEQAIDAVVLVPV